MFLAGCVSSPHRADVEKHLFHDHAKVAAIMSEDYHVVFPDVLEVRVVDRPELAGTYALELDGRITLPNYGGLRVEGLRPREVAQRVADTLGVPVDQVRVQVREFRSQYVMLFGQVVGWQRVVPYQGPETVLDLLQRAGGLTKGAAPEKVYVVRPHVLEGKRPEVFHVDLEAIVLKHDDRTNLLLAPFDQVYVGETRQAHVEHCIPVWLRPIHQYIWDTRPDRRALVEEAQRQGRMPWLVGSSTEPQAPAKGPMRKLLEGRQVP